MDGTSQRLNTIRDHLTKALSSSDSQLHFSKAWHGLSAIEDSESHKAIATGHIINLLRHFLNSTDPVPSRHCAGIIIARLCHKSAEIAGIFPKITRGDSRFHLVYGLGNLILEEGVHEDLRLICGLVIRSCVFHGVDHRIFWPAHEIHAPFPIDDGKQWTRQFYNFVRADDGLRAVRILATKGTTPSPGQAEFTTAALRAIEQGDSTRLIQTPRRISTTEAFNVSVLSSPPKQLTATMSGATDKLAKMRDKKRSEGKSAGGKSATILVPDSIPTRQKDHHSLDLNEGADPDEVTVIPETFLETSQAKDIQRLSGTVADAKKTEAIHHGPQVPEKRQEKSAKTLGKGPSPRSRINASNLASAKIYDLPQDEDDDLGPEEAAAGAPRKRGRPRKEPQGKRKTASQPTKRPRTSTRHASQKRGQANRDDSPEDSNDEDYQAGPTRDEYSQGHGGRRSRRLAAAQTGGSPDAMEQSPEKDHTDGESEMPGPTDTQLEKPAPVQDAPLTTSHADASNNLGTKSQFDTHEQRSSSPKHRSPNRSSDAIQLAPNNKARGEVGVEMQQNESYDDFEGAVTTMGEDEDIEILESKANKTMTAGPQSGTGPENSKQAKEPDHIQREQMAVVYGPNREHLPLTSASVEPPTPDVIDPALLEPIAEQSPKPKQRAVATRVSPALNQEESLNTQTHQTDETHSEAVKIANPGGTSQPDPIRPMSTQTTPIVTSASQPDPSRSVFARKQPAIDQNTHLEPTGTAVAKKVLGNFDASNNEKEIETNGDSVTGKSPPVDENVHRKLTIIGFDKTGPLNQGRTQPGIKETFKDHEDSRPSTTTKVATASLTKSHLSNKTMRATRTARTTYGSRSSPSFQVALFEELAQGPDEHHQHHEDKNDNKSQTLENSLVETAMEKASRQKPPSESDGEDFSADDFASLPPTEIEPSTPGSIASSSRQVHENTLSAAEIGPSTPNIHQKSPSPAGAAMMHPGPTPLPTNQTKRSLEKPLQDPIKPLEKEKSLSPGVIRDGLHAEIDTSLASNTGPTQRHDHQNRSFPVGGTVSYPGSTSLATNHGERSTEKPVQEIGKPLKKKRSLEPGVSHFTGGLSTGATKQPEACQSPRERSPEKPFQGIGKHLKKKRSLEPVVSYFTGGLPADATKQFEVHQSPRKRTKIENTLSSPHSLATKKLINSMKATTSASPAQISRRVSPVQRRPARRISNVGSPERRDTGQPGFTTLGDSVQRPQANIDDSPVSNRTQTAPSPASSYGILSSNRKKVPDPPSASSKAITSHAPEHMLEQSKLLNTPARPEADPFSSPKTSKRESAFMAMMREKTETQGAGPPEEPSTPGLEALINARPEDDPDKTLVNDDEFSDDASDTSDASTLDDDEAEEEDDEPRENNQHPSEMDWEASLKPHQQNLSFVLTRISDRLVRHLIDSETAIEDVVAAFEHDGMELVEKMEQAHQEEYEVERGALTKAKSELKSVLERISGKFRKDKKAYENRRNAFHLEAATGSSEKQIGLLEGVLMQLQG